LIHHFTEHALQGQLFLGGKQFNDQSLFMPSVTWNRGDIITVAFLECCAPASRLQTSQDYKEETKMMVTEWVVPFALQHSVRH
jgi:hypothetical protein